MKKLSQPGRYGDGGGLYLVVSPGLTKSWVLRFMVNRKSTDKGLGGFPTVSLSEARRLAAERRVAVKQGRNPWGKEEKRTAMTQAAVRSGMTFRDAASRCQAVLADRWRSEKTAVMWEQSLAKHTKIPLSRGLVKGGRTGRSCRRRRGRAAPQRSPRRTKGFAGRSPRSACDRSPPRHRT